MIRALPGDRQSVAPPEVFQCDDPEHIQCPVCGGLVRRFTPDEDGGGFVVCENKRVAGPNGICRTHLYVMVIDGEAFVSKMNPEDCAAVRRWRNLRLKVMREMRARPTPGSAPTPAAALTVVERKVMAYLCEHGGASAAGVARHLSRSRSTVFACLRSMKARGLVTQSGGTKGTVWRPIRCDLIEIRTILHNSAQSGAAV